MIYIVLFNHDQHWLDFRLAEFDSLLILNGLNPNDVYKKSDLSSAFIKANFPSDEVVLKICSRAILIKAIYQLWSITSCTFSEVVNEVSSLSLSEKSLFGNDSWSIEVEAFCRTLTFEQKRECRLRFNSVVLSGPVNVVSPSISLWILVDFSLTPHKAIEDIDSVPAYFGKLVSKSGMKDVIKKFDLKNRLYLGPTSLDHSLALILV